jgi:hypothetical protein
MRDADAIHVGAVPTILDVSADEYHRAPAEHFARLYAEWIANHGRAA